MLQRLLRRQPRAVVADAAAQEVVEQPPTPSACSSAPPSQKAVLAGGQTRSYQSLPSAPPPSEGLASNKTAKSARSASRGRRLAGVLRGRKAKSWAEETEGAGSYLFTFPTVPEVESIVLSAENVSPFSFPQELLAFEPPEEAVIRHFKNGEEERKIHTNTRLRPEEYERLRALQDLALERGEAGAVVPSVAAAASRYLSRCRGDVRRAFREMLATHEWRKGYFKDGGIQDTDIAADLALGIAYIAGRDRFLRPALVIRPARIPTEWLKDKKASDRVVRLLVFCMEYMLRYMAAPGRAEGAVVLLDLGGLSLSQVPMSALTSICTVMSNHYVNRVFTFYILNVPSAVSRAAGMGLRLLTERQRQKLQFVANNEELRAEFALHQLESDLGGAREVLTEFFPFPLLPGPFDAGNASGPNPEAVPGVHEAFTEVGMLGRILEPGEENADRRLELTERAEALFARCGLPPPAAGRRRSLGKEDARGVPPASPDEVEEAVVKADSTRDEGTVSTVCVSREKMSEDHSEDGEGLPTVAIQDCSVAPNPSGWFFFCTPPCKTA